MKKFLLTFALLLGGLSFLYSQTPEDIFKKYETETNAQLMTVGEDMLSAMVAEEGEDVGKLKNIESVVVLDLSQCDQSVKDGFETAIKNMKLDGYETLVQVNEDGVAIKVMGKVDGELVRDMIVTLVGEAHMLVQMKGSISMSDVTSMMNFN